MLRYVQREADAEVQRQKDAAMKKFELDSTGIPSKSNVSFISKKDHKTVAKRAKSGAMNLPLQS